jgi:transcriptional regulator with XRE-family HTH domain
MVTIRVKDDAPHAAFARRLNQVIEESDLLPPYNQGRYTWISEQLRKQFGVEVTRETVRKWVWGETIPRNEKLKALAKLFDVDEGWLAFGITSEVNKKVTPKRSSPIVVWSALLPVSFRWTVAPALCARRRIRTISSISTPSSIGGSV